MEGKRRSVKRTLRRVHQVSRLEAELWGLVYQQLWPWTVPKAKPIRAPGKAAVFSSVALARGA
jgi:hypothetical protein